MGLKEGKAHVHGMRGTIDGLGGNGMKISGQMAPHELGSHGTVVDEDTFELVTELEIRKAVRLQYYVSLLTITPDADTGEIPDAEALARQLAPIISQQLRGTDLIGVSADSPQLHVLLINAHLDSLSVVIQRLSEEVSRHVFQINGKRQALNLAMGGACFPTTAGTRQDLFNQATAHVSPTRQNGSSQALS